MSRSKQINKTLVQSLLFKYPITTDQVDINELGILLTALADTLDDQQGSVVEFGCYAGTTSLFIQRVLAAKQLSAKDFHVYDSFEGLPEKTNKDQSPAGTQFKPGALKASKSGFTRAFKHANLPLPVIHKAWFNDLSEHDIPNNICFAFLDGDYYESIMQSLELIENKLLPGAVIIIDDYQSESLPGAARATNEWLRRHNKNCQAIASLAVIRV